jgi:GT2 family glycosyltransferase
MPRHQRTQVATSSIGGSGRPSTCSIVIPVHNHASLTRQCLDALLAGPARVDDVDLVVVDDASSDGTPQVLAGFGDRIHLVTQPRNTGFAEACNAGAAASAGEYLVFLNNDTVPVAGWLDALCAYADTHREAAVVGAKLLFANDTIQHAGVVIGQDRYPRHLYAGFPSDHAAVNRSRRFQAVTGACLLIRRSVFDDLGGFDPAFRNGYEDIDLCLRCGERGLEVHYCHQSVLYHVESASRGVRHKEATRVYEQRWAHRVRPDDVGYYIEDGLLRFSYGDTFPLGISASPLLAAGHPAGDDGYAALLRARSHQVRDLLRETARLKCQLREAGVPLGPDEEGAYRRLRRRVRAAVRRTLPTDARTVVVSRGDEDMLRLGGRQAEHFPQADDGTYAGWYPADSGAAIAHLEGLRDRGIDFLVVPKTGFWWLDYYAAFREHLEDRCRVVFRDPDVCLIVALR